MTSRADLRADCGRCFALCCVAPAFARSSEFALDKPAGTPCPHLGGDHRCTIHDRLREEGFAGCTAYDCFGAGQRLAQVTFGGRDWRTHPEVAAPLMAALPILRGLHELLWYLGEALDRPTSEPLADALAVARDLVEEVAASSADRILEVDVDDVRARVAPLLREAGDLARAAYDGLALAGDDLTGADLRTTVLRGACLRGTRLLGADLRDTDLTAAELLGADLRGADLGGARLAGAIYLTQTQVGGARGDRRTTLPGGLERPPHW